ncbi:zinc ribbon domain-containing protein [Candidatus Peregrinibacteria bacterium]|nr:zinc ribbon domain-containing protein [Candidatus Peregrinibacteria bacterium]
MPIYEYECNDCGNVVEVFQKISEDPLLTCSNCSGKLSKLISQSSFHLKGTGWYVTDYKSSGTTNTKDNTDKKETKAKEPSKKQASDNTKN